MAKKKTIHELASSGDPSVMTHPLYGKQKDTFGYHASHLLAMSGSKDVYKDNSAHFHRGPYGETPLHIGAALGHKEAIHHPLSHIVRDNYGRTPLDVAAMMGHKEVSNHPNFHSTGGKHGKSPSQIAFDNGHYHLIQNFKYGDSVKMPDKLKAKMDKLAPEQIQSIGKAVKQPKFSKEDAKAIGNMIGINWKTSKFPVNEFLSGLSEELEHGSKNPQTDITEDCPIATGKIALAHLKEDPKYYQKLKKLFG